MANITKKKPKVKIKNGRLYLSFVITSERECSYFFNRLSSLMSMQDRIAEMSDLLAVQVLRTFFDKHLNLIAYPNATTLVLNSETILAIMLLDDSQCFEQIFDKLYWGFTVGINEARAHLLTI